MIPSEELEKFHLERFPRNDIGTSNLFATIWKDKLLYVVERKSFFIYNGKFWEKDVDELKTNELAKEFALSIIQYFAEKKTDNEAVFKYYSSYLQIDKRGKLLRDSKSVLAFSVEEFDESPYLFNCQNCTVNLATGSASVHDPLDYITKVSNVWYDPDAKSEEFERFISSVMQNDEELINYLQRALGYSLSSATFQECFFIMYGKSTRNGKGTLNSTMAYMLGDYAKTAPYEAFESKKYKSSGGASEEIARLAGSRYVAVSEPSEDMVLNSALIKTLSGNDKITARYLYENSFEFVASFKLWINTNHLPSIPDDSVFKSGRVQLIPFNKHFNQKEQDKGLKSRLVKRENISGAFNWCMEGFQLMAQEGGLNAPERIQQEIDRYREDNDRIGEFINDCFIFEDVDKKSKVKFSEVYKIYQNWCKESGYRAMNKKNLKSKMRERVTIETYIGQDHLIGYSIEPDIPKEWLA